MHSDKPPVLNTYTHTHTPPGTCETKDKLHSRVTVYLRLILEMDNILFLFFRV